MSESIELAVAIHDQWSAMWSGQSPVDAVMAPAFRLRYAQPGAEHFNEIRDQARLAEAVVAFRAERPGIHFTSEGPAIVNMDNEGNGIVARPYLATIPATSAAEPVRVSGTDIHRCEDGRVVEVWSVSARGMPFYG